MSCLRREATFLRRKRIGVLSFGIGIWFLKNSLILIENESEWWKLMMERSPMLAE